jgi:protein tyrosine phosphatase (PTP) superfamily phosphohydrolase (DUF442 family)
MLRFEPNEQLICIGQPEIHETENLLQNEQPKVWVNLRPENESSLFSLTKDIIESHDCQFIHLPVASGSDLNFENAKILDEAIKQAGSAKVVIQCGSSNRVGALLALREKQNGASTEEALHFGEAAGLTGLAPVVAQILEG